MDIKLCDICFTNKPTNYKYCDTCNIYVCKICICRLINEGYSGCVICKKEGQITKYVKQFCDIKGIIKNYKNSYYKFCKDKENYAKKKKTILFKKVNNDGNILLIFNELENKTIDDLYMFKQIIMYILYERRYYKTSSVYEHLINVIDYLIIKKN